MQYSCGRKRQLVTFYCNLGSMSQYTYPPPQPGQQPATTFQYGTFHPPPGAYGQPHPQTPGATPYAAAYANHPYPTGVTGYGAWPGYTYNFVGQQPHIPGLHRPPLQAVGLTTAASPQAVLAPRTTTFNSYSPSYPKETVAVASSGGAGRAPRKQVNHKGLFSKECESELSDFFVDSHI